MVHLEHVSQTFLRLLYVEESKLRLGSKIAKEVLVMNALYVLVAIACWAGVVGFIFAFVRLLMPIRKRQ